MKKLIQRISPLFFMCLKSVLLLSLTVHMAGGVPEKSPNHPVITQHSSGKVAAVSMEELFADSDVIAIGQFVGTSNAFKVRASSGAEAVFKDYYFSPTDILRGGAEEQSLSVRISGGQVGNLRYISDDEPDIRLNQEYLVFLYRPGVGAYYNTEGDYYYIAGVHQGIFEPDGNDQFISLSTGEAVNLSAVPAAILDDIPEPDRRKNKIIENLTDNLESGFITQEEYDQLLGNLEDYAVIVQ